MNKQNLIENIHDGRRELDAAVARISDERKIMVILHGEWSIKDLIGHLGFWEERVVILFNVLRSGDTPEPYEDVDDLNSKAIIRSRNLTLSEVFRIEEAAYKNVLAVIEEATDKELFDPNYFQWTNGRRFEELISDNTWGHYEEHLPEINAWLKRIA